MKGLKQSLKGIKPVISWSFKPRLSEVRERIMFWQLGERGESSLNMKICEGILMWKMD